MEHEKKYNETQCDHRTSLGFQRSTASPLVVANVSNLRKTEAVYESDNQHKTYSKSNHSFMQQTLQQLNNKTTNSRHQVGNRMTQSAMNVKEALPINNTCSGNTNVEGPFKAQPGHSAWQTIPHQQAYFNKSHLKLDPNRSYKSTSYASHFRKTSWPELRVNQQLTQKEDENQSQNVSFASKVKDKRENEADSGTSKLSGNHNLKAVVCGDKSSIVDEYKQNSTMFSRAEPCNGTKTNVKSKCTQTNTIGTVNNSSTSKQASEIMSREMESESGRATTSSEKRARRKARIKEEKKKIREEEALKKLIAPKDQKVTLIDRDVVEKYFATAGVKPNTATLADVVWEFPALGKPPPVNKSVIDEDKEESTKSNQKSVEENANHINKTVMDGNVKENCSSIQKENRDGKQVSTKHPKRRDPIQINLMQVIKTSESKQHKQEVPHLEFEHRVGSKKDGSRPYCGNPLDASNPERKRGKHREIPKHKKKSDLKNIILAERKLKKAARNMAVLQSSGVSLEHNVKSWNDSRLNSQTQQFDRFDDTGNINVIFKCSEDLNEIQEIQQKHDVTDNLKPNCAEITSDASSVNTQHNKLTGTSNENNSSNKQEHGRAEIESEIVKLSEKCLKSGSDQQSSNMDIISNENNGQIDHREFSINDEMSNSVHNPMEDTTDMNIMKLKELEMAESSKENRKEVPSVKSSTIHSRNFRDYCDHSVTAQLNQAAEALLRDVVKFHDQQYLRNPLKANAKRRHVTGLKEVRKYLGLKKVKLLIVAPNLEKVQSQGGLDDIVAQLKECAAAQQVPCVFALNRKMLGKILIKKVPVSCVGILNYEGTESTFHALMDELVQAREHYRSLMEPPAEETVADSQDEQSAVAEEEQQEELGDVNKQVVASFLAKLTEKESKDCAFLKVIESRTTHDESEQD